MGQHHTRYQTEKTTPPGTEQSRPRSSHPVGAAVAGAAGHADRPGGLLRRHPAGD